MCIICHCGDEGDDFLTEFARTSAAMARAKQSMLKCSHTAVDPVTKAPDLKARAAYDKTHKKIARMLREWNSIEQEREHRHTVENS